MSDGLRREIVPITSRGQWLAARQGLITASIAAALFDAHPYLTREELAGVLRGEHQQGDTPAMRRGRILEPAVAAAVEEDRPDWAPLRKNDSFFLLPDLRTGATPDYFVDRTTGRVINVQTKTVHPSVYAQWRGQAPLGYMIQVVTENVVIDSVTGYLAILITSPGYPLHLIEVPRHAAAERRVLDAIAAWWREHDAGRLPAAAPRDGLAADLDDGSHIDLSQSNDLPGMLADRAALKATVGECDKRLKLIDDTIRERVGAARSAWLPGWLIRYGTIEAKAYTVPARA